MILKLLRPRTLLLVILLIIVAALTYGFAAALTPTTNDIAAGTNATAMSDHAVVVTWTLNSTTPDQDPQANLDFGAWTPADVYAVLVGVDGTTFLSGWVGCDETASPDVTCDFAGETVDLEDIYYIRIAAGE